MFKQTCYPTQAEASWAACSSVASVGTDGTAINCTAIPAGASTTAGGAYTGNLTVQRKLSTGVTSTLSVPLTVGSCERYDYAYWSPAIGAWVAALVAIIAARVLYLRVFSRETL